MTRIYYSINYADRDGGYITTTEVSRVRGVSWFPLLGTDDDGIEAEYLALAGVGHTFDGVIGSDNELFTPEGGGLTGDALNARLIASRDRVKAYAPNCRFYPYIPSPLLDDLQPLIAVSDGIIMPDYAPDDRIDRVRITTNRINMASGFGLPVIGMFMSTTPANHGRVLHSVATCAARAQAMAEAGADVALFDGKSLERDAHNAVILRAVVEGVEG